MRTDKVTMEYLLREKLERLVQSEIKARVARMRQVSAPSFLFTFCPNTNPASHCRCSDFEILGYHMYQAPFRPTFRAGRFPISLMLHEHLAIEQCAVSKPGEEQECRFPRLSNCVVQDIVVWGLRYMLVGHTKGRYESQTDVHFSAGENMPAQTSFIFGG